MISYKITCSIRFIRIVLKLILYAFIHNNNKFLFPLLLSSTVYSAELYTIWQSLILCLIKEVHVEKALIFTDSLSALQALQSLWPKNPLCVCITNFDPFFWPYFLFCTIIGLHGNDMADYAAKEAALLILRNSIMWCDKPFQNWNNEVQKHLFRIKPKLGKWYTCYWSHGRARLRVGHPATLLTHGHWFTTSCPRSQVPNTPHLGTYIIILSCPIYSNFRNFSII